jgi:hypothetical protein
VRHEVGRELAVTLGLNTLAAAPPPRSRGVCEASRAAALVALRGLAPCVLARCARAGAATVALTAVAAATKQHLRAAPRAHEQAGAMLGQAVGSSGRKLPEAASPSRSHALRWTTTSGNATLAPHSLLACVGYGARFSLPGKLPSPYPPTSGHGARSTADGRPRPTLHRRRHSRRRLRPRRRASNVPAQTTSPWRLPCRAVSKANSSPVDLQQPTGANTAQRKTASSPPNKRGSRPPFTPCSA